MEQVHNIGLGLFCQYIQSTPRERHFPCTMSLLVVELVVQFLQNHVSDRNVECILRLYHAMP